MLRTIYVQILLIMMTACSAMEEFEILKSRKFSYLDRDIAFLLGHNYQLYSLKIDLLLINGLALRPDIVARFRRPTTMESLSQATPHNRSVYQTQLVL